MNFEEFYPLAGPPDTELAGSNYEDDVGHTFSLNYGPDLQCYDLFSTLGDSSSLDESL
jgi:hypothetical protein